VISTKCWRSAPPLEVVQLLSCVHARVCPLTQTLSPKPLPIEHWPASDGLCGNSSGEKGLSCTTFLDVGRSDTRQMNSQRDSSPDLLESGGAIQLSEFRTPRFDFSERGARGSYPTLCAPTASRLENNLS
jgi:hypothetical protein